MNIEIANRLVQLRKQNHLSQEELAARIGVSRQAVSKWERAEASPDTDNLILLARLYQVSLDDLLRTDDLPEPAGSGSQTLPATGNGDAAAEQEERSRVSIGWNGLHVVDGDEEVHIGWRGIHVKDSEDEVHIGGRVREDEDSTVLTDEDRKRNRWLQFPYPVLATLIFFGLGFGGGWWHPGWLVFLTVPLYYALADIITRRRSWVGFALSAVCMTGFFLLGFLWDLWHPGWLLLLPIPLYYILSDAIRHHKPVFRAIYPILTLVVFLGLGFGGGWWHPGWLVFLTVPLFYSLADVLAGRAGMRQFAYPVLTALAFFLLGFFADGWSWCWLVFLTVPLYYALFPEHRKPEEDTGSHEDAGGDSV